MAVERTLGSWTRTVLGTLPESLIVRLKGDGIIQTGRARRNSDDATFLAIVSARQQFKPQLDPSWRPPVSEGDAMQRVVDWLRAG
jgi:hypothetical protein